MFQTIIILRLGIRARPPPARTVPRPWAKWCKVQESRAGNQLMADDITHTFQIGGMTCGGCSGRVTRVLEATQGVHSVSISHEDGAGVVTSDARLTWDELADVIRSTGFTVE